MVSGRHLVCIPHSTPYCLLSLPLAEAKRQTSGDGSAYSGAFGVDSQDILNVPDIDFGTFQMFPDQFNYGTTGPVTEVQPPSSNFDSTMNDTVAWIRAQINCAHTWGFPSNYWYI